MRKIRVNLNFILVVLALIALLITQAFQALQLYDRKHIQFETNVATSLERIAIRHEKAEDIRRYMHIINHDFSGQYKDILKEEFKNLITAEESIKIKDTIIFSNGEIQNYLVIRGKAFDSISGLSTEQKVLARDVRQLRDLFEKKRTIFPSNDSVQLSIQLDKRVIQQVFKKAKFVNEMMVEAFRNSVYEAPSKKVDVIFLDSIIKTELANDDLPKHYRFMITDENGVPVNYSGFTANYDLKLDTLLTEKTTLFPSNIIDEDVVLHIYFPQKGWFMIQEMWGPFTISLTLVLLIVIAIVTMFKTIMTQEKIAELKNDFISNMTHEFKTPISTISLACEAMNDKDMLSSDAKAHLPFIKMISDENKRLSLLVERILQSAVMDRGELKLIKEKVNLNELIQDIAEHTQFRIESAGGSLHLKLQEKPIILDADRMHVSNIVSNLVDNAIKYSRNIPFVEISLSRENKHILLSVKDRGIGMKKEHLDKIFEKLYRIPTGNLHDVKGFGLGLSYVKTIAELHGWDVYVKSQYGVGSEFVIVIKNE